MLLGRLRPLALLATAIVTQLCSAIGPSSVHTPLRSRRHAAAAVTEAESLASRYPARYIAVPVDHFHNDSSYEPHSDDVFSLRYWFDASHYRKGGPVIVLLGGETTAAERLPFMEKGILYRLARATNGMAVVLEHRYYGDSFPTPDLSTRNLRFLTTDQALADTAFFARNVVFDGFEDQNLTSYTTPYFTYGGSYAGAFSAFARKLYPDVFWGAISSSGVPLAVVDYWQYFEAQRRFAPLECVIVTQRLTKALDTIAQDGDFKHLDRLKEVYGLSNLTDRHDFASVHGNGMRGWQSLNWDPSVSNDRVYQYCANVSSTTPLYPDTRPLADEARDLLVLGGYEDPDILARLVPQMLNHIGWTDATLVQECNNSNATLDQCFSLIDPSNWQGESLSSWPWRSWEYQVCTQWGYFTTGSGVPANQLPLQSRLIDVPYLSLPCKYAFNISGPPDVDHINKLGGLNFSYPRLAFIDGEADPWLYAGVHAPEAPERNSSDSEPFILIGGKAVHHWDENGIFENETSRLIPPKEIDEVQAREEEIVQRWLNEWRQQARPSQQTDGVLDRTQFRHTLEDGIVLQLPSGS